MKSILFALLMSIIFFGCDSSIYGEIEIIKETDSIIFENNTTGSMYFRAIDIRTAALIYERNPCDDYQPNLESGAFEQLEIDSIMGVDENSETINIIWTNCKGISGSRDITI